MKKTKIKKVKNVIEVLALEEPIRLRFNARSKKCDSCGNSSSFKFYNNSYLCAECFYMDRRGISRLPDKSSKR